MITMRERSDLTQATVHADDFPAGKLMEAITERVDEFYLENLPMVVISAGNLSLIAETLN